MRIAVDLRPLQIGHEFRGIGAYLKNVLENLPKNSEEHTFIFIRYDTNNPLKDIRLPKTRKTEELILKNPPNVSGFRKIYYLIKKRLAPQFGNIREYEPDVFLQPDFLLGFPRIRGMKKYLVMYDLIPLVLKRIYLPDWKKMIFQPGLGKRRRIRFVGGAFLRERGYISALKNLKKANKILCISESTANDLKEMLSVPDEKLVVTRLAPSIMKKVKASEPKNFKSSPRNFLLYVGGTDQRRRLSDLVYAFNLLNGRGVELDLVFVGKDFTGPIETMLVDNVEAREAIMKSSYSDRIHCMGYVSQTEKSWLFRNAFAFVYPTLYEGFGLPILEAMHEGCPVVTYKNSSLPEIAGSAAILLEDYDIPSIFNALNEIYISEDKRREMIEEGKKQSEKFSWSKCAEKTLNTITAI